MQFKCEIGDKAKIQIEFFRDAFWGTVRITANGKVVFKRSPFNPLNHFSLSTTRRYEFDIDGTEKNRIIIEKQRPLVLAGFRANRYVVFCNGNKVGEFTG